MQLFPRDGDSFPRHLGEIFHALARQKECQILEGHLMPDRVHMCIAIRPQHPVASVMEFLKGKSAIAVARLCGKERNFTGEPLRAPGTPSPPWVSNWSRSANTSANKRARMEPAENSKLATEGRIARRLTSKGLNRPPSRRPNPSSHPLRGVSDFPPLPPR